MKFNRIRCSGAHIGFLPCLGLSLLSVPVFTLIGAALASASEDPTAKVGLYSLLSLLLAAAVGGFIVSRLSGEGGIKIALLCALAVVMVMLLISVIVTGGAPSVSALMNYGCYLGVYALAAILGKRRGGKRRRR
ncbi:MAG: hypothetical protein IJ459_04005 [Clostridia bacterium]|nr:hypothetical protein [Clostridia bacterium]